MHIILPGGMYIIYTDNHIMTFEGKKNTECDHCYTACATVGRHGGRSRRCGRLVVVGGGHTR